MRPHGSLGSALVRARTTRSRLEWRASAAQFTETPILRSRELRLADWGILRYLVRLPERLLFRSSRQPAAATRQVETGGTRP